MAWLLKHGDDEAYLREIEADTGHTPPQLLEKPDLPVHLRPVLEAFRLLSDSRPMGYGALGGISTADIMAISGEIEPSDPLRFLRAIRAMDALLLADFHDRTKTHGN